MVEEVWRSLARGFLATVEAIDNSAPPLFGE